MDLQSQRIVVTGGSGFLGSHLVAGLTSSGAKVLNIDRVPPTNAPPDSEWLGIDIMDAPALTEAIRRFAPHTAVHLAARVDVNGDGLADYEVNTVGTRNAYKATKISGATRFVLASTQFVCKPGYLPTSDTDYAPHTWYGRSKVEAENLIRGSQDGSVGWVIIRPTTLWGPGDLFYRRSFYKTVARGLYLHPSSRSARRSYGYVTNVIHQVMSLIRAQASDVEGRTFYVGDPEIDIAEFADEFSRQLRGRKARRAPLGPLRLIAAMGDAVSALGIRAPLNTRRLRSMTEDYPVPISDSTALFGPGPVTLDRGVRETVQWLRSNGIV